MFKRLKRWLIVKLISVAEKEWGFHFVIPPDRWARVARTKRTLTQRKALEPIPSISGEPSSLGEKSPDELLGKHDDNRRHEEKVSALEEVQKYRDEYLQGRLARYGKVCNDTQPQRKHQ